MKDYDYALSITSQFYFCSIPFRLDISPKCTLNCSYCFAMAKGGRKTQVNQILNYKKFAKKIDSLLSKRKASINTSCLSHKIPIHLGGISDPFSNDSNIEVSKKVISKLNEISYPFIISTKRTDILCRDDIFELISNKSNVAVQVSFSNYEDDMASLIERNVPKPSERIKDLKSIDTSKIFLILRLQPLIPNFMESIEAELLPEIRNINCKHIITEFLKIPVEKNVSMFKEMQNILNFDFYEYYKDYNAKLIGREWLLPTKHRYKVLYKLKKKVNNLGISFSYADYGLYHLSDTDCCCGIDKLKCFSGFFKGNFSYVIKNSEDQITFDDVLSNWIPDNSIKRYLNSHSRIEGYNSMVNLLRKKWNNPGSVNSPNQYLGVSHKNTFDKNGNYVYFFDKDYLGGLHGKY